MPRPGDGIIAVAAHSACIGVRRSTLQAGMIPRSNGLHTGWAPVWAAQRLPWRARWPKRPIEQARTGENRDMAVVNVKSEIAGNVWKIQLKAGDKVDLEGEIMILESMKMEIPVLSPKAGTIKEIKVNEGEAIGEGQLVAVIDA
jgi:biotin carboxyl carrier protein